MLGRGSIWPIVLAGGEGRRMQPFIQRWLGERRPKQYCTFVGTRSMLEHSWCRALAVARPGRVITVVGGGHRHFLAGMREVPPGPVIEQPLDRGTAPGVFLPTALALAGNPEAIVVVMPSDHFVHPEWRFVALVQAACRCAAEQRGRLVMLGATPLWAETDFGWILPGARENGSPALPVLGFEEKPDRDRAERFLASGSLWNTMVVAARADTLWQLGKRLLPEVMRPFDALLEQLRISNGELPPAATAHAVARAYDHMPRADFSRDLVQACPESALVLPLGDIAWSDWGRPERVGDSLRQLGKKPAFDAVGEPREPALSRLRPAVAGAR